MFVTDLTGSVYQAGLDGSRMTEILLLQGNLTGISNGHTGGDLRNALPLLTWGSSGRRFKSCQPDR